jgi:hypothetical protein
MKRFSVAFVLLAATLAAGTAVADVSSEADTLFTQGQALLADKKIDAACPVLERSEKLEPRGGTLLSLAYCHEQQGRAALAYTEYEEALRRLRVGGGRSDRETFAQTHMATLHGKIVTLMVEFSEAAKAPNAEIIVSPSKPGDSERKIVVGADRRQPIALDVDGGAYKIEVRAPERKPFTAQVSVAAQTVSPAVINVTDLAPEGGAATTPGGAKPAVGKPEPDGSGQRTLGLVIGGVGVLFLAGGIVGGVAAKNCFDDSQKSTAPDRCSRDTAMTVYANIFNVGIGLGAVGLLAGGYLYLSAPKGNGSPSVGIAPALGPSHAGFNVAARF